VSSHYYRVGKLGYNCALSEVNPISKHQLFGGDDGSHSFA
jgi:hypothetical protein